MRSLHSAMYEPFLELRLRQYWKFTAFLLYLEIIIKELLSSFCDILPNTWRVLTIICITLVQKICQKIITKCVFCLLTATLSILVIPVRTDRGNLPRPHPLIANRIKYHRHRWILICNRNIVGSVFIPISISNRVYLAHNCA